MGTPLPLDPLSLATRIPARSLGKRGKGSQADPSAEGPVARLSRGAKKCVQQITNPVGEHRIPWLAGTADSVHEVVSEGLVAVVFFQVCPERLVGGNLDHGSIPPRRAGASRSARYGFHRRTGVRGGDEVGADVRQSTAIVPPMA
jgi:hypothetical protein